MKKTVLLNAIFVFFLVVEPIFLLGIAAWLSRAWAGVQRSLLSLAVRYAYGLVPLGFGMWLAHYSFHFLGSWDALVPALQRFALDRGWTFLGEPDWVCDCCRPVAAWLLRLEILFLDLGLLLSLYTGYRIALAQSHHLSQTLKVYIPWAFLALLLFAVGLWLLFQPMQSRI